MSFLSALVCDTFFGIEPLLNPIHALRSIVSGRKKYIGNVTLLSCRRSIENKL